MYFFTEANKLAVDLGQYKSRFVPTGQPWITTYAAAGLRYNLTTEAWPRLRQILVSDARYTPHDIPQSILGPVDRLQKDILTVSPSDLLVLGSLTPNRSTQWRNRVAASARPPKLIIEL
jgi:hypothetical protein